MSPDECLACCLFEKTNYENLLREIGGGRPHSVAMIAADRHGMLNELILAILPDGLSRISEAGYRAATDEAIDVVLGMANNDA